MNQANPDSMLGIGIYTPAQAAKYARTSTQLVIRWVHGYSNSEPALLAQLEGNPERFVTFQDFIQTMAVKRIRHEHKVRPDIRQVPLQRIRKVVKIANDKHGIRYPFAQRHITYLYDDDIVLHLLDSDTFIQITGKYKNHYAIKKVVEFYADDLVYGDDDYAITYTAWTYKEHKVILDPTVRFGEPMLYRCDKLVGVSANELAMAYRTEGSFEAAADVHGVEPDDIEPAVRYEEWILPNA